MDTPNDNGTVPTVEQILADRHRLADRRWDELSSLQARAKAWANKDCRTCYGRGWTGFEQVPIMRPSPIAPSGQIKVGSFPRLLICHCVEWGARESGRLHQENVSASNIAMRALEQAALARQELLDFEKLSLLWWVRHGFRLVRARFAPKQPEEAKP